MVLSCSSCSAINPMSGSRNLASSARTLKTICSPCVEPEVRTSTRAYRAEPFATPQFRPVGVLRLDRTRFLVVLTTM